MTCTEAGLARFPMENQPSVPGDHGRYLIEKHFYSQD